MVGSWNINVVIGAMPQRVATAIVALSDSIVGAEYTPILYIGSQLTNGTNHAVLAEQLLTTGRDTKNIVLIIFNEKGENCDVVSIERILESGEAFGGVKITDKFELLPEHIEAFNKASEGFVGGRVKPEALLATQITDSVKYFLAAKFTSAVDDSCTFGVVVVNVDEECIKFVDILANKVEIALGYAFTW